MRTVRAGNKSLSKQVTARAKSKLPEKKEYDGNFGTVISTGSTLLDLAISGGRIRGGGLPGGIFVEIFGPSSAGKTVLLCEIAGAIQRTGGEVMFHDPEARLNQQFARMFDLNTDAMELSTPDTVNQVFTALRKWEPKTTTKVNGIIADSLAALSTDLEMDNDDGDKMGMKRAKDFSEQLRKSARIITQKNYLMVASNQIRENAEAKAYGLKYKSPGGLGIGFYASLRLKAGNPSKIYDEVTVAGKKVKRVIGVETDVEVFKSSIWKPFRSAPVCILFDYGIDDIRSNLQFIKDFTKNTVYTLGGEKLSNSKVESIAMIEEQQLEQQLKDEVIDLWEEIESKFTSDRKKKER